MCFLLRYLQLHVEGLPLNPLACPSKETKAPGFIPHTHLAQTAITND